jgi:hypothetical protein
MDKFACALMSVLLLAAAGLGGGCGSTGAGLLAGSNIAADAPGTYGADKKFSGEKYWQDQAKETGN